MTETTGVSRMTKTLSPLDKIIEQLKNGIENHDGGEINPSNYTHDDVHHLNDEYIALFQTIEEALRLIAEMKADCVVVPRIASEKFRNKRLQIRFLKDDVFICPFTKDVVCEILGANMDQVYANVIQAAESEQKGEKL